MLLRSVSADAPEGGHQEGPEGPPGTPEAAPLSSLVPSSESVGEICPSRPLFVVCDQDPDLRFPASCDRYRCDVCGPRKCRSKAALLTYGASLAPRRRLVTLTAVPEDWQAARGQVRDFVHRVREGGFSWEWGWAREANPRATGLHLHGVQHGDYVPQDQLVDLWGGRVVDVRALKRPGAGVYAIKEALRVSGYVTKGGASHHDHLDLNGGRAVHFSRGFLHGKTSREAMADVAAAQASGEVRTWHLEDPRRRRIETGPALGRWRQSEGEWA